MNIFRHVRAGSGGRSIRWEDGRSGLSANNGVTIAASAINNQVHTYEHQLLDDYRRGDKNLLDVLDSKIEEEAAGCELRICEGFHDFVHISREE